VTVPALGNRGIGAAMPANFLEIADCHRRLAAQQMALAHAARDRGDFSTAEFFRQQAARYIEAAEEQRIAMSHAPGQAAVRPLARSWTEPDRIAKTTRRTTKAKAHRPAKTRQPLSVPGLSALRRCAGHLAVALQHSLSGLRVSVSSLSLPPSRPAHASQLRG